MTCELGLSREKPSQACIDWVVAHSDLVAAENERNAKLVEEFAEHCPFWRFSQEELCRRIAVVIRGTGVSS